jgi:Lon protease-like protein
MVAEALAGDRLIGIVLLRPGWEADYEGQPPVYPIGCSGVITHFERLPDGRYNIILRGLDRFRIRGEERSRSYRVAQIDPMQERDLAKADRDVLRSERSKLEALLSGGVQSFEAVSGESRGADPRTGTAMADEDVVNALAQYLDLEPLEKQALLEKNCLRSRAEALVELLEMKLITARFPGTSNVSH